MALEHEQPLPEECREPVLPSMWEEVWQSTDHMFSSRMTGLLVFGPAALIGSKFDLMGEALCFGCAGLALIPCAERLSFITEQVAMHTNGTMGALLNATFGNAPELLISVAALRSGFYRLTQLTMLGSMITNMIFVFGLASFIGGLRWHVQDLRLTSGNVSVVMLLVSTAGSLIPATLILSGHFENGHNPGKSHRRDQMDSVLDEYHPTQEEITLSRVNAAVMFILYLCFLVFQLGSHRDEFDDDELHQYPPARPNTFCRNLCYQTSVQSGAMARGIKHRISGDKGALSPHASMIKKRIHDIPVADEEARSLLTLTLDESPSSSRSEHTLIRMKRRVQMSPLLRRQASARLDSSHHSEKDKQSDMGSERDVEPEPVISMRVGIFWLLIVTMCISAVTDVLVDTIDGFAQRMKLSQVFTSMVIIPFFSNVAEQVSAIIFAYRNKMDLCVGVTVGSAIQIATFVLPGAVLMAGIMDRSMTLYFHSYETVCWFFCTVVVAAVLQNGTTNWLVGACLVGIYIMFAAGIWYHEIENLSYDAETGSSSDHGS